MLTAKWVLHVELDVWVRNEPVAGLGPKEPNEAPVGSVIWKVISLSYDPELKLKSIASPLRTSKETVSPVPAADTL